MSEQESFEARFKELYPYDDISGFEKGIGLRLWNAATAEANKRINALESEVAELKFSIKCLVEKLNEERTQFSEYKKEWSINAQRFIEGDPKLKQQISQLQASNNDLREKLETALTSLRKYENGI